MAERHFPVAPIGLAIAGLALVIFAVLELTPRSLLADMNADLEVVVPFTDLERYLDEKAKNSEPFPVSDDLPYDLRTSAVFKNGTLSYVRQTNALAEACVMLRRPLIDYAEVIKHDYRYYGFRRLATLDDQSKQICLTFEHDDQNDPAQAQPDAKTRG